MGIFWERAELKNRAKTAFQGNYGNCVLAALILVILTSSETLPGNVNLRFEVSSDVFFSVGGITLLLGIFVCNVFEVGGCRYFLENRDYNAPVSKILFGFQGRNYGNVVFTMFLVGLKIFLWTLLLVIPGIVKAYEYRMVPYILAEQPDINQADAFAISREMMRNQKFEAFCLDLSFIGWSILAAFSCGLLGIFWVSPYIHATNAELYAVLRDYWMMQHNPANAGGTQGEY